MNEHYKNRNKKHGFYNFLSNITLVTLFPTTPPNLNCGVGITARTSNSEKNEIAY